ncbi:MAG: type VI secretion system tube protein Hcp [Ferruginibacter sp.]|nr:type VI secretion system tube protein Hcp [Ferruginibacter sp.]
MALNSYLQLKGEKQGDIKGSVIQKGREGKIMVIAFEHEVQSPRDPATGQATGKRVHRPFVVTKEIDRSSPLLYAALVNNENITSWELQCFVAKNSTGVELNHYTVKLTNAKIADIRSIMLNNKVTENLKMPLMEEVGFVYEKIEWIWVDGGITTTDEWSSKLSKTKKTKK